MTLADHPADDPPARRAGRDAGLRHPTGDREHRAAAVPDRLPDGCRRLSHPREPLHRSDRHHLRPARQRAEPQGRSDRVPSTPEIHADDLHRIIEAIGRGPVDLFASSGGAVNALALVAAHPDDVRTLVAHEPPLASVLPDREHAMAAARAIHETYQAQGLGRGHGALHRRDQPPGRVHRPRARRSPDRTPRCSGCRPGTTARGRTRCSAGTWSTSPTTSPDWTRCEAPRPGSCMAAGEESGGTLAHRGAEAVAERLGTEPVIFPGDHGGFLGGEYGQTGEPDAFAAKLREVLASA